MEVFARRAEDATRSYRAAHSPPPLPLPAPTPSISPLEFTMYEPAIATSQAHLQPYFSSL